MLHQHAILFGHPTVSARGVVIGTSSNLHTYHGFYDVKVGFLGGGRSDFPPKRTWKHLFCDMVFSVFDSKSDKPNRQSCVGHTGRCAPKKLVVIFSSPKFEGRLHCEDSRFFG